MRAKFSFEGRLVLVTGAARGIGLELTRQLGAKGARVLAVGRDQGALDRLRDAQRQVTDTYACDLSEKGAPQALADWVAVNHPTTSVLINNAAIMVHTDLTTDPHGEMDEIAAEIATNLTAPIQLAVAMLPVLRGQNSSVVNVTSGLAIAPKPGAAVYCATKAGLRSFTRAFRDQCRAAGLPTQVSEVVMTLVDTTLSSPAPIRKYPPARAAADLIAGVERGLEEVWIEKTKLLRVVYRLAPGLAYRIMRGR